VLQNDHRMKTIAVAATLDTRGDEVAFLRRTITDSGHKVISIDMGVLGVPFETGDITREQVALAGGASLQMLQQAAAAGADRSEATRVMVSGARQLIGELLAGKRIDAVIGLGGSTAAAAFTLAVRDLPVGFPKLLVTTFAHLVPIGDADLTVMQSPVDLIGLNAIVMRTLGQAAQAVIGMAHVPSIPSLRPLVAITALGVTTPAVQKIIARLEALDIDGVVFHATTSRLNRMIEAGAVDAVIDLTTYECVALANYSDERLQSTMRSRPVNRERLAALCTSDVPWIVSSGGLDMHIVATDEGAAGIPDELKGRIWSQHGPGIVLVRTDATDMRAVAKFLADRIRQSQHAAVFLPARGFSAVDRRGAIFYEPTVDSVLIEQLKSLLGPSMTTVIDCHINDDEFADALVARLSSQMHGE
jgi:uncharacterized protein (UPF0261 family)